MFASAGKPALLLVYHLASHLAGGRGPSARFVEAFETEDWAPEAVLIMMNATAAAAAFAGAIIPQPSSTLLYTQSPIQPSSTILCTLVLRLVSVHGLTGP